VRAIADEVAMLHAGRIIWRGPVEALDAPGDARVEAFVHGRADDIAA
jgi:phospholipid/cholesterol/gamma-HCH transport system ATP-binding protein